MKEVKLIIKSTVPNDALIDYIKRRLNILNLNIINSSIKETNET